MRVSVQYAREHFADIAGAADRGEDVEIEREGKPRLHLVAEGPTITPFSAKKRLLGAAVGEVWLAEDWDSVATNQAIEDQFANTSVDPKAFEK